MALNLKSHASPEPRPDLQRQRVVAANQKEADCDFIERKDKRRRKESTR
jgi:hypothetical protein